MKREDIIRLAREADSGFDGGSDADGAMGDSLVGIEAIERFAALAAEHGAAAEREACKKLLVALRDSDEEEMGYRSLVRAVEAIEAREDKT